MDKLWLNKRYDLLDIYKFIQKVIEVETHNKRIQWINSNDVEGSYKPLGLKKFPCLQKGNHYRICACGILPLYDVQIKLLE